MKKESTPRRHSLAPIAPETHSAVAMASDLLEATPIQNPDQTSLSAEDATMLKQPEGFGYRGAANSKAPREQILRDWKFIHIAAILRSEKPARQPLQERVPKTARRGLRTLHQGDVQIAVQNCPLINGLVSRTTAGRSSASATDWSIIFSLATSLAI